MGFLSSQQIEELGFAHVGEGACLSDKATYYGCSRIHIGNRSRVDDFCVISAGSGGIYIGDHVHIAVHAVLIGAGKISVSDFSGISSHAAVYSSNDDYSGKYMTGPTVPEQFKNVTHADVIIGRHSIIGASSVVLPGVHIKDGATVGALSLVKKDCKSFGMYAGVPAQYISERKKDLLEFEKRFLADNNIVSR